MLKPLFFEIIRLLPTALVLGIVLFICGCIGAYFCYEKYCTNVNEQEQLYSERIMFAVASCVVGDLIFYDPEEHNYHIGGKIEPPRRTSMPILGLGYFYIYALIVMAATAVIFSELFFFDISFTCNDDAWTHCYTANSTKRIQNCSTVEDDVTCYRVKMDIVVAAGVTGGLLSIVSFLSNTVNCKIIKLLHKYVEQKEAPLLGTALFIVFIGLLVFVDIFLFVFYILGFYARISYSNTVSDFIIFSIQYLCVFVAITMGELIPVCCVFCRFIHVHRD